LTVDSVDAVEVPAATGATGVEAPVSVCTVPAGRVRVSLTTGPVTV
jgi:hypothetical protein